jgi:hypothetical protein
MLKRVFQDDNAQKTFMQYHSKTLKISIGSFSISRTFFSLEIELLPESMLLTQQSTVTKIKLLNEMTMEIYDYLFQILFSAFYSSNFHLTQENPYNA